MDGDADKEEGKEGVGQKERVAWKHLHYRMLNRSPVGICSMTQGIQTGAL